MPKPMNPFQASIENRLAPLLLEKRVIVWYDPHREFGDFISAIEPILAGTDGFDRLQIGGILTRLAVGNGSLFGLKLRIEPLVADEKPEPLLIYLPDVRHNRLGSPLMELEKAGECLKPQNISLERLAREELSKLFTQGQIDEMLATTKLTYSDVAGLFNQRNGGFASILKLVLGEGSSCDLLVRWLASDAQDDHLIAKGAQPELFKLVGAYLELPLASDTELGKARHRICRYVLINEFRDGLKGISPATLAIVAAPNSKQGHDAVRETAKAFRTHDAAAYTVWADRIQAELQLEQLGLEPSSLGSIDTFRFQEKYLLRWVSETIVAGDYEQALGLVANRKHSFWLDRDWTRLAQWEAAKLMAQLGLEVTRVRPLLKQAGANATKWVEGYAQSGGWFELDRTQRQLEAWLASLNEEPEGPLEQALGQVRRAYETLLHDMALGFTQALSDCGWHVEGVLHQTDIYPIKIQTTAGRVAYFFVDAMRYEMAVDLATKLVGVEELSLVPAIAALPSITLVGMAALLPGASSSFSVLEHKGKLAVRIGNTSLAHINDRLRHLKAIRPDMVDFTLDDLLQKRQGDVQKKLGDAQLVIVRSQEIDTFGEGGHTLAARQVMNSIIDNLARAVRKLAKLGIQQFVISADHGHQFSLRKEEDMQIDNPGGETVDLHRRCWIGHGGQATSASLRVNSASLGYSSGVDFIFPKGVAVFRSGGDLNFHHGGTSLQEMVIPVVSFRMTGGTDTSPKTKGVTLKGYPEILTNRTFGLQIELQADLFSSEDVPVRLILLAEGQEVGRAGMAVDAQFDTVRGIVMMKPGKQISVGMMLIRDEFTKVRIVAQSPDTDALLAQSNEIAVQLGI